MRRIAVLPVLALALARRSRGTENWRVWVEPRVLVDPATVPQFGIGTGLRGQPGAPGRVGPCAFGDCFGRHTFWNDRYGYYWPGSIIPTTWRY